MTLLSDFMHIQHVQWVVDLHTAEDIELRWKEGAAVNLQKVRSPPAFEMLQTSNTKESQELALGEYYHESEVNTHQNVDCWSS